MKNRLPTPFHYVAMTGIDFSGFSSVPLRFTRIDGCFFAGSMIHTSNPKRHHHET